MATHLHDKKLDVTVLNIDIQEFYYNINFDFNNLNNFMQQIHTAFHEDLKPIVTEEYSPIKFLPIELVSSAVIANYVLSKSDKDIAENLKPEYYGRYMNDMIFCIFKCKY
jgi:hypothetical protein